MLSLVLLVRRAQEVFDLEFFKWGRERIGVGLSGKARWPRVCNLAEDGLARGRIRERDQIVAVNGVQVFDESVANRLLREAQGRLTIRIYRTIRFNVQPEDDLTEIAVTFSSRDELDEFEDQSEEEETGSHSHFQPE